MASVRGTLGGLGDPVQQVDVEPMNVLDRLEALRKLWQGTSLTLNGPASAAQIEEAEGKIGAQFPEDVRQAYLRFNGTSRRTFVRGGVNPPDGPSLFFLPFFDWVSLERMVEIWRQLQELSPVMIADGLWPDVGKQGDVAVWGDATYQAKLRSWGVGWLPQWIPVGDCHTHQKVYIDLSPAPAGIKGQLIYTHEDTLVTEVAADSFTDYLERFLTGVESGQLVPLPRSICWGNPGGPAVVSRLKDAGL